MATWRDHPRFHEIPSDDHIAELAYDLGRCLFTGSGRSNINGVTERLGWQVKEREINSLNGDRSSIKALLVPLIVGDFSFVINTAHRPPSEMKLWLLGHEIGHSLFYTPDEPPRRIVPLSCEEETFCDKFADRFVEMDKLVEG